MRIADKMNFDQVKSNLAKNRSEMVDLQNQASSQKRVNKPSDDPLAAARVLATRTEINTNSQFLKNVNGAKAFLEYSEQSLGELAESLMRAKELAIGQANDASGNESSRQVVAAEVEQIISQAVQIGNRKLGDRFLFGGFRTTKAPFDQNGQYRGDNGEMKITINKEAAVSMNIPGSVVFLGVSEKNVDSASLEPRVRARAPSPDPSSTDPNLNLLKRSEGQQRPDGPRIRGPASVANEPGAASGEGEGGETPVASNVSSSWQTGGVNIFSVLQDFHTSLRANDKGGIQESLDRLDEALAHVVLVRSSLGSRVMTLNSATEGLQKSQVDAKIMASNLEDADTFELVSDINKTESTLKASLATSGKLIQPSLLDFLR